MIYIRPRLLRKSDSLRHLVRENLITTDDFIVPIFLEDGAGIRTPIASMPGYFRLSLDMIDQEIETIKGLNLKSVLLFTKVESTLKDNKGTEALNPLGLMQRGIKKIKQLAPDITVMSDVALDPFSSYGHDGIVKNNQIINDESVEILAKMSVSHAQAGADVVAPSDMMDGRIKAIREALESEGFKNTAIMSYTAKYASALYGPFRDALDSAPGFGDKKSYQMDYANRREALKEAKLDLSEGADILMIKPAISYLDIIRDIRDISPLPIAAYQVSGEYSMIKAACQKGWLDYKNIVIEQITSIKRAGADLIASYFAKEIAQWIKEGTL